MKIAHHGSYTSTSSEFLMAVSPAIAVLSVGADNRFGHPNTEVMSRLKAQVSNDGIYSTATDGTIELITDGVGLWVKTQR